MTGLCVPVRFQVELNGTRADINTDDIAEFVDSLYLADDRLSETEDDE